MKITIKRGITQDFPFVFALMQEFAAFQKTPEKLTVTLEQLIAEQNFFKCLVAETDDKKIAGFASFFFAYYSWSGKAIYLDDLYVSNFYRKQGIGKQLLNSIIDLAKREGCKNVRWLVSNWNLHAIEFYKKTGATIDETDISCNLGIKAY